MRTLHCVVLNREAEGLNTPPHPGELGIRIYHEVSKEGWKQWLQHATAIINENHLNTADPKAIEVLEQHMRGFLFKEGNLGQRPPGFQAAGGR